MRAVINSLRHTRLSDASKIVNCFCTHIHAPPHTVRERERTERDRERQRNSQRGRNSRDKIFITLTHKSSLNSYFIFSPSFQLYFSHLNFFLPKQTCYVSSHNSFKQWHGYRSIVVSGQLKTLSSKQMCQSEFPIAKHNFSLSDSDMKVL